MGINQKLTNYKNNLFSADGLSLREQLGYAGGIFGNSMGQDTAETYADKFERNFMGIKAENMLLKSNIALVSSFIVPPLIGAWYDKPAKIGKKDNITRALSMVQIPFTIVSLLRFIVPSSSASFNLLWALVLTLFFSIADNFFDMAMEALALKVVRKPSDRKNFYTLSSIASTLGSMLPGWLIPLVVGTTDEAKRQQLLYLLVAFVFAVIGITTMYAPYRTICRKNGGILNSAPQLQLEEEEVKKVSWDRETVRLILHNRPFIILQLSRIFETVRTVTYSMLPYLYDDTFDNYGMKAIIDMISGALSYVGLFSVPFVASRVSARNILSGGYMYSSFFYGIMSLFNLKFNLGRVRKWRYLIGVLIGISGMPNAAQGVSRKIILADSTDYMEWYAQKNGISVLRCDGLLVASQSIVGKIIGFIKSNLYNSFFLAIKYKENDLKTGIKPVQSNSTLRGIFAVVSLCGFVGNALAGISVMFDNYTGARKQVIYAELTEMRAKRLEAMNS